MSLLWWKSKQPDPIEQPEPPILVPPDPVKLVSTNTLTVFLKNEKLWAWTVEPWDTSLNCIEPWKDFYHWYFGREASRCYVMRSQTGETMVLRSNILGFKVEICEAREKK